MTIVMAAGGCSDDGASVETPTSATTTTVAEASITEEFADTLAVNGSGFYSFTVEQYGTVTITLEEVGGTYVPGTVWLGLGLGSPSGIDCSTSSAVNVSPGAGPHLTGTYDPGVYCAKVWDIGNLYAPARFRVVIAHP